MYIVSQIFAFVAFLLSLIAFHRKKKESIFKTLMLGNVLDMIHYLLLGAYSGCITKVIAFLRNEIIVLKEKNKKYDKTTVLVLLLIIYLISGILTYKNIYSVLPILSAMIYLYVVWNGNALAVKKIGFYCYFLWLIYNICVFSIVGIISSAVSIISTFIAVYNEKRNNLNSNK